MVMSTLQVYILLIPLNACVLFNTSDEEKAQKLKKCTKVTGLPVVAWLAFETFLME